MPRAPSSLRSEYVVAPATGACHRPKLRRYCAVGSRASGGGQLLGFLFQNPSGGDELRLPIPDRCRGLRVAVTAALWEEGRNSRRRRPYLLRIVPDLA